jgi:toxin FitB
LIVLDTNVVSETMRARPEPAVLTWLDRQQPDQLWLTAVNVAELMVGVARLPPGLRRQQLAEGVAGVLEQDFAGRVLSFDTDAAAVYAELVAVRERAGRPIAIADAQIAAICLRHGATLATRNQKDFDALGLPLVNPWDDPITLAN